MCIHLGACLGLKATPVTLVEATEALILLMLPYSAWLCLVLKLKGVMCFAKARLQEESVSGF